MQGMLHVRISAGRPRVRRPRSAHSDADARSSQTASVDPLRDCSPGTTSRMPRHPCLT